MKHTTKKLLSLLLVLSMLVGLFAVTAGAAPAASTAEVYDVRVDDLTAPVGIDNANPVFSWKMKSDAIGAAQTAYSIIVTDENGEEVWNDGWTTGDKSVGIVYDGDTLTASTEYTVKIAVQDQTGAQTAYTETTFETGLMSADPFADADWISYNTTGSDLTSYTIDFDFILDRHSQGFCFGMQDTGTFVMWQVNAYEGIKSNGNNQILLRPHYKKNNQWADYPGKNGSDVKATVLNDVIGCNASELVGKLVHERIVVDGKNITTYFGEDESNLVSAGTYTYTSEIALGKFGFRHCGGSEGPEIARYDNLVIRDGEGTVIYSNDFSGEDIPVDGNTTYVSLTDGMLQLGNNSLSAEQVYIQSESKYLPAYRTSVNVQKELKSAKLYTAGLGVYESYINGARVGRKMDDGSVVYDELKPGFTEASKRQFYHSYDVTWMLEEGENVLSAMVTSGWWSGDVNARTRGSETAYMAKLILTYSNGETETIVTDTENWKTSLASPLLVADIFDGETYDARVDLSWMLPGYNDQAWKAPKVNTEFKGTITAQYGSPIAVRKDLERTPASVTVYDGVKNANSSQYGEINVIGTYGDETFTINAGETAVVDFGQNFAGWEYFELEAERGTKITVKHGEMLNDNDGLKSRGNDGPEGSVYLENLRTAVATTNYYAAGNEVETYHPAFTYYGFRYISITATKTVTFHKVRGQVVTSVDTDTGFMTTSDEDVNQLISNVRWGMYSNYLSAPTDCPQRDERQGWTGDTQAFSLAGCYMGYSKSFLMKFMQDMRDGQGSNGAFPSTAPTGDNNGGHNQGPLGWVDAGIIVPYHLYVMYGDTSVITENWDAMVTFMDKFMGSTNGMGGAHNHGDWLSYEANDTEIKNMLGVSYYAWDAMLMSEMAAAIGDTDAVAKYQKVYEDEKALYQSKYVNADGSLKRSEQSVCLYALYLDLLPDENSVAKVTEQLISNIESNGNKLQTGFLGTAIINNALTKIDRSDVAYKLLLQHDNPSWLYSVDQGATTIWERWNSYTVESGFGPVDMNSFNHYAYGAVAGWMFRDMAGISYDTENPGFKHIILAPQPDQLLKKVEASYESVYGTIVSKMNYVDDKWTYECTVPANTTATIQLPVENIASLTIGGKAATELTAADGLTYKGYADGIATFEAVAGSYAFSTGVAVKCNVKINVNADAAVPPMEAVVYVNGKEAAAGLPATLSLNEGDKITVTTELLNNVDYVVENYTEGETVVSEGATLDYTVTGDADITMNVKWIGLESLATGKNVTAGQVNTDWKAEYLTDGILSYQGGTNGWSSVGQGKTTTFNEVTAVIDLGEETQFNRFHLYPRNLPSKKEDVGVMNCPTAYTFYVSDDNQTWTEVYSTTEGPVTNGYAPIVIELDDAVTARYVKFGCTAVNNPDENGTGYVQLSELGIYMVSAVSEDVEMVITGTEETSVVGGTVSYTLSAENMNRLATVALAFQVSEETLTNPVAEAAGEDWFIVAQSYENGILTVVAANNTGVTGAGDLLKITAQSTGKAGEATLTLTKADLAAYEGEGEKFVPANLDKASATTNVTLNPYDVNRDGVVDLLDITRAQRYYGTKDAICDVNKDGEVNITDLILILNNFTGEY